MGALGASGAGHIHTLGDKEYVFMPWTQGIMDAFESWLVYRLRQEAMEMAELYRRKARKLMQEAKAMRERGKNGEWEPGSKEAAEVQVEWNDMAEEAQSMQTEAREMVNRINEMKAIGAYHFYGNLANEAKDQFNGRVKLAHLCLLSKQPALALAEVDLLAKDYWVELGQAMKEANDDTKKPSASAVSTPPSPTPTTSTSTTPSVEATVGSTS